MEQIPDTIIQYVEDRLRKITLNLYQGVGYQKNNTFPSLIRGLDIAHNTVYMPEFEHHGYTFFTRPRLNLTTTSLRQDRIMRLIESFDINTITFAIRAMLDSSLISRYKSIIGGFSNSELFNESNPFIPMLSNKLHSLTGWPDVVIETETSEGGYYSESITYPIGHDKLSKEYELTASFSDMQGSPVLTLILIWTRYLYLLTEGRVTQYIEDTEARRMGFTSSIYRFVLDPSKMFITKWAKATGCYPKATSIGAFFNYDSSASQVEASKDISVPFTVAGKIDYMDPIILSEFNTLVRRYCPDIDSYEIARGHDILHYNFRCIPFIDLKSGTNELQWRYDPEDNAIKAVKQVLEKHETETKVDYTTGVDVKDKVKVSDKPLLIF